MDIVSDLHLEFNNGRWQELFRGKLGKYLIVAGDLCEVRNAEEFRRFFDLVTTIYRYVIYVPGNHEYYGGYLDDGPIREILKSYGDTVVFLQDSFHEFAEDRLVVYGTTLWTSSAGDVNVDHYVARQMTDYKVIYQRYPDLSRPPFGAWKIPITRQGMIDLHQDKYNMLETFLEEMADERTLTKIVVTHHPPMRELVNAKESYLASGYSSDLRSRLVKLDFDYWICGHTHHAKELDLHLDCGKVARFIVNPYGYPDDIASSRTLRHICLEAKCVHQDA